MQGCLALAVLDDGSAGHEERAKERVPGLLRHPPTATPKQARLFCPMQPPDLRHLLSWAVGEQAPLFTVVLQRVSFDPSRRTRNMIATTIRGRNPVVAVEGSSWGPGNLRRADMSLSLLLRKLHLLLHRRKAGSAVSEVERPTWTIPTAPSRLPISPVRHQHLLPCQQPVCLPLPASGDPEHRPLRSLLLAKDQALPIHPPIRPLSPQALHPLTFERNLRQLSWSTLRPISRNPRLDLLPTPHLCFLPMTSQTLKVDHRRRSGIRLVGRSEVLRAGFLHLKLILNMEALGLVDISRASALGRLVPLLLPPPMLLNVASWLLEKGSLGLVVPLEDKATTPSIILIHLRTYADHYGHVHTIQPSIRLLLTPWTLFSIDLIRYRLSCFVFLCCSALFYRSLQHLVNCTVEDVRLQTRLE